MTDAAPLEISLADYDKLRRDGAAHTLLDVREREAYRAGHIPGAMVIPRGQLELSVNEQLPDPTQRIVVYCQVGKISTLATATLREMGFTRAVALDGGIKQWSEAGYPLAEGDE